jgi:Zn-dependent peptidase ImmA (M78 family)
MDFKKIKAPFLNNQEIKEKANAFRRKFWNNHVPVDIENIIELKLKLDIIPKPGFQNFCGTDALISSNWQAIYVDHNAYLDERYQNRLRFSLAHEIGHFVLHRNFYNALAIEDTSDFYDLFKHIPQEQYGYLETQANKFANYLLVPRKTLSSERDKVLKAVNDYKQLEKLDKGTLNSYLAIPISKVFGVSEKVVEIALNEIDDKK